MNTRRSFFGRLFALSILPMLPKIGVSKTKEPDVEIKSVTLTKGKSDKSIPVDRWRCIGGTEYFLIDPETEHYFKK